MFARYFLSEDTMKEIKNHPFISSDGSPGEYKKIIEVGKEEQNKRDRNIEKMNEIIQKLPNLGEKFDINLINDFWFPVPEYNEYNIFISHSHNDSNDVLFLVGFMKLCLNLTCFVDSWEWGYIDSLCRHMNEKYSTPVFPLKEERGFYNYTSVNKISSILNIALIVSLQKTMHNIELSLFLETKNSILENAGSFEKSTSSPWLYAENMAMNMLRPRIHRDTLKVSYESYRSFDKIALDAMPKIVFPLGEIPEIYHDDIMDMFFLKEENHPFDILYKRNPKGTLFK